MTISRAIHNPQNPYKKISSSIYSYGLSAKAIGVLTFLLHQADRWEPNVNHLASVFKDGKTAIQNALDELKAARFIVKVAIRDCLGRIVDWVTTVHETPLPESELPNDDRYTIDVNNNYHLHLKAESEPLDLQASHPDPGFQHLGNQSQTINKVITTNSEIINQDPPLPPQGGEGDNPFEEISNTEEPDSNSTTPSNPDQESMQQPENQGFDNFSAHSPEKEKPAIKTDKYFYERSVKQYKQGRAEKYVSYPQKTGLTPEEFNEFEKECLTWGMMHPETIKSPTGWLQDRLTSFTVNECRFSHLEYWRQHRTLKNFLDKIPAEWEETYVNEYGWLKTRIDESFEDWLIAGQKKTGMTDQEAIEKVRWQLKDYQGISMLWKQFKIHAQCVERRVEEQQKLGASGLGEIPNYFEERKEISLEQYISTKQKLSQASGQFSLPPAKSVLQNVLEETQKLPQLPETTMQEEFDPDRREELRRAEEMEKENEWVEQNPELARENVKRLNQMRLEAEAKSQEKTAISLLKKRLPATPGKPNLNLEQLQGLWATGSAAARNQVSQFIFDSEDFEFEFDSQGQIVGVREIEF